MTSCKMHVCIQQNKKQIIYKNSDIYPNVLAKDMPIT